MRSAVAELFRSQRRPLTIREVAAATGLHANTVRFHLGRLVHDGTLCHEASSPAGRGRPATRYVLAPSGGRGGARNYELLARMLLAHLATEPDPPAAARRAGEQWGRQLTQRPAAGTRPSAEAAMEALTGVLTDLGFDPRLADPTEPEPQLELRHCPFLELAQTQGDLVCRMHHGLLEGALAEGRAPLRVRTLQPFVEPTTCVAHLRSLGTAPEEERVVMSDALAVAALFAWLGMVLAISFLEAPLKFRAPGVTLALGLGIGRLVFRALNACEVVLAICVIAGSAAGATASTTALVLAIAAAACLLIQVIALQPVLDRRAKVIIAGGERTPSKGHVAYIALELIKVGLLIATGVALLNGLVR